MKSSKGDGVKHTQTKAVSTVGETGPLFPRLHVSETEKVGPRAPPRNKMALYEQFTVPSNRFIQPNRSTTTASNQQLQDGPSDYRYPFLSYCVPFSVPYSNMNHGVPSFNRPSQGLSSCVTSCGSALVNDEESLGVSRRHRSENTTSSVGFKAGRSMLEPKVKDAINDNVRVHSNDPQKVCDDTTRGGFGGPRDKTDKDHSKNRLSMMDIAEGLPEALSTVKVMECTVVESPTQGEEIEELSASNDGVQLKEGAQKLSAVLYEQIDGGAQKLSAAVLHEQSNGGSLTPPEQYSDAVCMSGNNMSKGSLLHLNDRSGASLNGDPRSSFLARKEQSLLASGNPVNDDSQTTLTSEHGSRMSSLCKDNQKVFSSHDEKGAAISGVLAAESMFKTKGESVGESETDQIGIEHSHRGSGMRGDSGDTALSVLASLPTQAIKPKDVIRALGQQQFWKARKALLRQQHIFSDQVFQLHKLIKVQQLLAETPGTMIDEEMLFGGLEESDASPHQNLTDREHCYAEKGRSIPSCFEEKGIDKTHNGRTREGVAHGNDPAGSNTFLPTFTAGGTSAWGYPSLGMGQWMGSMAAPGRPFAYQPTAGSFPPGVAYNSGLYGAALPGPVSPLVPFSIPFHGQRNEIQEEMSSNHGSTAPNCHGAIAMGHMPNNMPNDLFGAWHFVQYSNPYYNPGFHAGSSGKDFSTGSGASINDHRATEFPGGSVMQYPYGTTSHAGGINTSGRETPVHQNEVSSPSIGMKSKIKSSACMTTTSRRPGYRCQDVEHRAQNADMEAMKWSKCQQGGELPATNKCVEEEEMSVDCSSDHSGNALDLFPLVPSISPDVQAGPKQARRGEKWHGRVIKAVPHPAVATSQSAAGILLSLQRERQQ